MKDYIWWKGQKKRVQKKYTLSLGRYLSPKEVRKWYKHCRQKVRIVRIRDDIFLKIMREYDKRI